MGEFADRVFKLVQMVPCGKVSTYGQIARLMGRPQSARYVGFALRTNPEPATDGGSIPCHRIVFKDGSLCDGFAFGGPTVQRELLQAEGVVFVDDAHVDMGACLWNPIGIVSPEAHADEPSEPPSDFDWEAELGDG